MALDNVVDLLHQKDFKRKLIKKLNKNVDFPIIDEKTEQKILDKLLDDPTPKAPIAPI